MATPSQAIMATLAIMRIVETAEITMGTRATMGMGTRTITKTVETAETIAITGTANLDLRVSDRQIITGYIS
jgi:hypothetical protein